MNEIKYMKDLADGKHESQLVKQEILVEDGEAKAVLQSFRIPGIVGTVVVEHKPLEKKGA